MPKSKNPNRVAAFNIYKQCNGTITTNEIATRLNENPRNITYWKKVDKWKKKYNPNGGAPIGNQNALGNNGGAPMGNQNARTDGWYSKYFPTESKSIVKELEDANADPLEILWAQIITLWAAIIRSQKIMFVKDIDDKTKEIKKLKLQMEDAGVKGEPEIIEAYREEEYELQFAWDKQANFLNAQSRAMTTLSNMLKKYDDMLHANWDVATEEQKLRVEKMKVQLTNPELEHRKEVSKQKLDLDKKALALREKEVEARSF